MAGKVFLLGALISFISSLVFADADYVPFSNPFVDCESVLNGYVPCKRASPVEYEAKKHYFSGNDFSWSCNIINSLEFNFFNSSKHTVRTVVMQGLTNNNRLTESVFVPPGKSKYVYSLQGESFCRNEKGGKAVLYFEYQIKSGGKCLSTYSSAEIGTVKAKCSQIKAIEEERNTIYNNCVIAKSKGVDRSTLRNVRSVCSDISRNPSTLQRWRWGD